ncbi:MAG: hypothetical protein WD638_02195 [Nitriliruptoraceae bacterium]
MTRSRRTISTLLVGVALVTACQQDGANDTSEPGEEPADEASDEGDDSGQEDGEMDDEGYGCQ